MQNFESLFNAIKDCKLAKTCPARNVRQFYPANAETAKNYPVMFICESPATRAGFEDGSVPVIGWNFSKEDEHFRSLLQEINCGGAYITNFIKCGALVKCKPSEIEIKACLKLLYKEIELIKPKLLVLVGNKTKSLASKYLKTTIPIMSVFHYSWRRRPNYDAKKELDSYLKVKEFLDMR